MQLNPRENFAVVRQLEDPYDAGTYYVRAVIRNAQTDAIIATLDLALKDNQRYAYNWLVPADPSGQGFWISVVSSVYTDAGHTTKSQNYGDRLDTYLVQERVNPFLNQAGGGGGPDISYKKIEQIVDTVVENRLKPIKFPKISEIVKAIIGSLPETPEQEKMPDILGPLARLETSLMTAIKAIEPVKLAPVLTAIRMGREAMDKSLAEVQTALESGKKDAPALDKVVENAIAQGFTSLHLALAFALSRPVAPIAEPKPEPKPAPEPVPDPRIKKLL